MAHFIAPVNQFTQPSSAVINGVTYTALDVSCDNTDVDNRGLRYCGDRVGGGLDIVRLTRRSRGYRQERSRHRRLKLSTSRHKSGARWLGAALICVALPAAAAGELTVISFGRADRAALAEAYLEPFAKATGIAVNSFSYDGQVTELTQMVQAGAPVWDVMQVESRTLEQGCRQGLFEKLDPARVPAAADLIPGALSRVWRGDFHLGAGAGLFRPTPRCAAFVGRLLGYPQIPGQTRTATQRQIYPGDRAAGRRRRPQGRVLHALDRSRGAARFPEARSDPQEHRLVGGRRAAGSAAWRPAW